MLLRWILEVNVSVIIRKNLEIARIVIEGKITGPNFFYLINFSILRKLFAFAILRVEFEYFYSG
jgi:hypothetical protein